MFPTIDGKSVCWQIEIDRSDRETTELTLYHGSYQFTRMHFGLRSAPATCQRVMDVILFTVKRQYAVVYFSEIAIYSETSGAHIKDTGMVLRLLNDTSVTFKHQNCAFFINGTDYFGHIIRPGRPDLSDHSTVAIRVLKTVITVVELRSSLEV